MVIGRRVWRLLPEESSPGDKERKMSTVNYQMTVDVLQTEIEKFRDKVEKDIKNFIRDIGNSTRKYEMNELASARLVRDAVNHVGNYAIGAAMGLNRTVKGLKKGEEFAQEKAWRDSQALEEVRMKLANVNAIGAHNTMHAGHMMGLKYQVAMQARVWSERRAMMNAFTTGWGLVVWVGHDENKGEWFAVCDGEEI
jgi:hypothetical protein